MRRSRTKQIETKSCSIFLYLTKKESKMAYHTRSNSLPSKSNLISSQFDEQISRIRSSESASSSSINSKLTHLSNLYDCIEEFLQLPSSQTTLISQRHEKSVEDSLEGSIKLLDVCSIISDVCLQMKEHAQELQSILRRRCSEDEISNKVAKYWKSKKTAMKAVSKALKELKKMENNYAIASNENINMNSKLRDCQMVTLNVLESVLMAMVGDKANSRWESIISKLMKSKKEESVFFFVGSEAMDAALNLAPCSLFVNNFLDLVHFWEFSALQATSHKFLSRNLHEVPPSSQFSLIR